MIYPLFVGGPAEILLIAFILALLFGGDKLVSLARSSGKAMGEFKKEREKIEEDINDVKEDVEGDFEEITEDVEDVTKEVESDITFENQPESDESRN